MLWGGELLLRDGEPCGQVTSAAWGATVGASVGLGLVRAPGPVDRTWLGSGTHEVDVAGTTYPVTLSLRAPL
jgi:4-methylaminobutanoate oxidase (formaldehyde-forming)